jgi:hypothetical protein
MIELTARMGREERISLIDALFLGLSEQERNHLIE